MISFFLYLHLTFSPRLVGFLQFFSFTAHLKPSMTKTKTYGGHYVEHHKNFLVYERRSNNFKKVNFVLDNKVHRLCWLNVRI